MLFELVNLPFYLLSKRSYGTRAGAWAVLLRTVLRGFLWPVWGYERWKGRMLVQDSLIVLGASLLAVWLWFVLVFRLWFILPILLLGFGRLWTFGAGSGFRAEAILPALIWFVFFCVWCFVLLVWRGGRLRYGVTFLIWDLVDLAGYDVPDSNLDRKRQFFARGGARGSRPGGLAGGFALVEFKDAEHGQAEISDAVGGAEIHLALAEVVDGLPEHLDHVGGILKRQGGKARN